MAIGFATAIDREGRVVVRCGGFQACNEVKTITERITSRRGGKPLKVTNYMQQSTFTWKYFAQSAKMCCEKVLQLMLIGQFKNFSGHHHAQSRPGSPKFCPETRYLDAKNHGVVCKFQVISSFSFQCGSV